MDVFGIGVLEIGFVLILGILLLGPEGLVRTAKTLGRGLRSLQNSRWWRELQEGYQEVQDMPRQWLEEIQADDAQQTSDAEPPSSPSETLDHSAWRGKSRTREES